MTATLVGREQSIEEHIETAGQPSVGQNYAEQTSNSRRCAQERTAVDRPRTPFRNAYEHRPSGCISGTRSGPMSVQTEPGDSEVQKVSLSQVGTDHFGELKERTANPKWLRTP
jgi:hypothetical protein